ncbi:MAG: lipase maturation factor family protein [Isosphaeraceae bacterium]|nr:lipase maturation factor family protein [Isosphaeraceae bacterium]
MIGTAPSLCPLGPGTYVLSTWLFLRALGVVYFVAFASLAVQVHGLVGSRGILPVAALCDPGNSPRWRQFLQLPTLCWWNTSDRFLMWLTWGGALLSLGLMVGLAPIPILATLWLAYLSLVNACGVFLAYQWDALLLETGLLAIFLAPRELLPTIPPTATPSPWARWLLVWLLFRLMFSSGVIKLRSRDPTWRNLSALQYHYETQPLPTPLSWYAHHLPAWFHRLSAAAMFVIELIVPFLVFAPAPLCYTAAAGIDALMVLIMATGNYGFFNVLTIALTLLLFDDAALIALASALRPGWRPPALATSAPLGWDLLTALVGLPLFGLSLDMMVRLFWRRGIPWPAPVARSLIRLAPYRLANGYGLFAVMTTERPEIIVEGSRDGEHWHAYEFRWKPGTLTRRPRFVAPHQPRLDWQMWFAALSSYYAHPWIITFLGRLLEGSPEVLRLLQHNPFPESPPPYVRALLYDYRFTSPALRRRTGAWWRRELIGLYLPPLGRWRGG